MAAATAVRGLEAQVAKMSKVELEPLHADFGAIVHGLDLTKPLDEDQKELLVAAMHQYDALLFRDQQLSPADQERLLLSFPHDEKVSWGEAPCEPYRCGYCRAACTIIWTHANSVNSQAAWQSSVVSTGETLLLYSHASLSCTHCMPCLSGHRGRKILQLGLQTPSARE